MAKCLIKGKFISDLKDRVFFARILIKKERKKRMRKKSSRYSFNY